MITILENARIVISLLKAHNIRYVVASPGGSNIPIVEAVQQDPFFKVYLNSATLLKSQSVVAQNRPECDFSCSNWLFAIS